jgi:branched-chain amino acid transport system substrate-binding protein
MKHHVRRLLAATAGMVFLSGCALLGSGDDNDDDYRIAVVLDQTGVSSQLSIPVGAGIEAYLDSVNEDGGIDGRRVVVSKTANGQSTTSGAQGAFQNIMQDEPLAIVGSVSTLGISGVVPTMKNAGTPVLLAFAPDPLLLPPSSWLFTQVMPAESQIDVSLAYLEDTLGSLDGKRLAVSSAASSFGDAYVDAFEKRADELGYEVALVDRSSVTLTSFATNAAKIEASDADALLLLDVPSQTSLIMKDLAAVGFSAPVVGYESASDPTIFEAVASDQYVSFRGAPVPETSGDMADAAEAAGVTGSLQSLWFSYGWNEAAVLVEALRACGEECTSKRLIDSIEATTDYAPPGESTFGPVSYSPTKHFATTTVQFYTWDDPAGREKPIFEPISTD